MTDTMPLRFAETDAEIARCFPALHVLRPHLSEEGFVARIRFQQREGYRLAFVVDAAESVVSAAGFRIQTFLAWGRVLYIDDLVTLPEARGNGYAGSLLDSIIAFAEAEKCDAVHLDSGYVRHDAHRLYLNKGFVMTSHHFARPVSQSPSP